MINKTNQPNSFLALFDPEDPSLTRPVVKPGWSLTPGCLAVLCFTPFFHKRLKESLGPWLQGHHNGIHHYLHDRGEVALVNAGIGAPALLLWLEQLRALGTRRFLTIGSAGALGDHYHIGDLALGHAALRDEGGSHHYLPAGIEVSPFGPLTTDLELRLREMKIPCHGVKSWSTDAVYRETLGKYRHATRLGATVVEMEAAALFAFSHFHQLPVAALFLIADRLTPEAWKEDSIGMSNSRNFKEFIENFIKLI